MGEEIFDFDEEYLVLKGKFGQRNNLGKNEVIHDPGEFFNMFFDHRRQINRIMRVSPDAIRVQSISKTDFVTENPASNIVIRWV
jgi:hypothetical protein